MRKKLLLLSISILIMRFYKQLKLLLFCVDVRYEHYIAFYDQMIL